MPRPRAEPAPPPRPDLMLADGRFRAACRLALARECLARPEAPPSRPLLHNRGRKRPRLGRAAPAEAPARHLSDPR